MQGFPVAKKGQVVGLLGGSFDPPHAGHVHISKTALTRFELDQLWWLVSPGNPLKKRGPAPLKERMQACRAMVKHPKVQVTDIEVRLQTRFTAETIQKLVRRYPGVRFVWLMGADNLDQFDRWQDWQWIIETVPIGVMARPGDRISARMSRAARVYRQHKLSGRAASVLGQQEAPSWCFINMPMSDASSTAIRERGEWQS
ncbi:nicotinate-nucleotide adenylyltransferase [Cognatiyoonia sp.]|uniref:nicotinate-nucleotide adenylyltransferase n=1 Tax=Cognatiyoonia sp. TaxID=2211652 RepID=UPI003F69BD9A